MPKNKNSKKELAIMFRNQALINEALLNDAYKAQNNKVDSPPRTIEVRIENNRNAKKPDESKKRKQQEAIESLWSSIWDKNPPNAMTQTHTPAEYVDKNKGKDYTYLEREWNRQKNKQKQEEKYNSELEGKFDEKKGPIRGKELSSLKKIKR